MPDYAPPIARTTDFHFNSGGSDCRKFSIGVSLLFALAAQASADAATFKGGTAANAALNDARKQGLLDE